VLATQHEPEAKPLAEGTRQEAVEEKKEVPAAALPQKPSFWSSLRSLGTGLPIGVSDDAVVDADAGRYVCPQPWPHTMTRESPACALCQVAHHAGRYA
jgi:hypothetical protein